MNFNVEMMFLNFNPPTLKNKTHMALGVVLRMQIHYF